MAWLSYREQSREEYLYPWVLWHYWWVYFATKRKSSKYLNFFSYFSEFETILTSLEIKRVEKKKYQLDNAEQQRIEKILQKAFDKETGKLSENDDSLTEDNPEGREYYYSLFNLDRKLIWKYYVKTSTMLSDPLKKEIDKRKRDHVHFFYAE